MEQHTSSPKPGRGKNAGYSVGEGGFGRFCRMEIDVVMGGVSVAKEAKLPLELTSLNFNCLCSLKPKL